MMRVMLYEAAQSMLRSKKWSWLKAWAMKIAKRRGIKKAIVALARRLAVIYGLAGVAKELNGMVILVRANLSGLTWRLEFPSIGFDPARFSCCCSGLFPGPAELGAVNPDNGMDRPDSNRVNGNWVTAPKALSLRHQSHME